MKAGKGPTAASTACVSGHSAVVPSCTFASTAVADRVHEGQRAIEELARRLALHDLVMRGQQQRRVEGAQAADGRLVAGGRVVARRDQAVAGAVADAVGQHGVDDDRGVAARVPQPEVPGRVAGQRDDLDAPVGAQAQRLAAGQADVDGRVAAQLALEEGDVVGRRAAAVGLVPAVVLRQHRRRWTRSTRGRPRRTAGVRRARRRAARGCRRSGRRRRGRSGRRRGRRASGPAWPGTGAMTCSGMSRSPVSTSSVRSSPTSRYWHT